MNPTFVCCITVQSLVTRLGVPGVAAVSSPPMVCMTPRRRCGCRRCSSTTPLAT